MTFSRIGSNVGKAMINVGNRITNQATYGAIGGFGMLAAYIGTGAVAVPVLYVAPVLFKATLGYGAAGFAIKGTGRVLTMVFHDKVSNI